MFGGHSNSMNVNPKPSSSEDSYPLNLAVKSDRRLRVLMLGSGDRRPQIIPEAKRLKPIVEKFADIGLEDFRFEHALHDVTADLAIVFGGDGSILRAAPQMAKWKLPVIGVNLGKLGFLADITPAHLEHALQCVVENQFRIVNHLMIRCRIFENSELIHDLTGLNELAILGGPPFSMQLIELLVDGELATTYRCDGLIVSTPVGSTAHNLSVGGPILRKDLQAIVISPISPHTLTVRPVVDTAERIYEIVVLNPNKSTSAVLDGQMICNLTTNHRVRIERAQQIFQLVEITGKNYYRTLREKLRWGGEISGRK